MDDTQKKQLEIDKARYERLKSVLMMDGWKEIESIIIEIYHEALNDLVEKGDDKSRGAVFAMKEFVTRIDQTRSILEHANQKYIGSISKPHSQSNS